MSIMVQTLLTVWACAVVGLILVYLIFVPDPDGRTLTDSLRGWWLRRRRRA